MEKLLTQISELGVVPVVTIDDASQAISLGQALIDGGIPCAEITFRTEAAAESLAILAKTHPSIILGAGTILTVEQAETAIDNGAVFIVTPGFDEAVVDYCLSRNVPIIPGVITPTELNLALRKGITTVKFFPAEAAGGVNMLKSISSPYPHVRFMPTGGVKPANLANYLAIDAVLACGGTWMVSRQLIADGKFTEITQLVKEASEAVRTIRGQ